MERVKRRQALLLVSLTIVGMILLALSLPTVQFQAGSPIPGAETGSTEAPGVQTGFSEITFPWLLQFGLALGIILLVIALITALLKNVNLKRTGLLAAALLLLFVLFSQLPRFDPEKPDTIPINPPAEQQPAPEYVVAPIGEPPADLLFWVSAGLLFICIMMIAWMTFRGFRKTVKDNALAREAEAAIQAIAGGQSLRDVIIHCYLRMERVVAKERGIERGQSMTPREFEACLVEKGIPRTPVLQLTSIFERTRYGNKSLEKEDEHDAVSCLSAIQQACQYSQREIS